MKIAPDARSLAQVPLDARDAEAGGGNEAALLVDFVRLQREHAEVPAAGAAGEAAATVDRHFEPAVEPDAPREEGLEQRGLPRHALRRTEVEDAGVLEKELPLLGKEEREAGEVDAQVVHLDLGEVGVVGEVERERSSHAPLEVEAGVGVGRRSAAARAASAGPTAAGPSAEPRAPSDPEPSTYGLTSRLRDGLIPVRPCSRPASETRYAAELLNDPVSRGIGAQNVSSFLRRMRRSTFNPQLSSERSNRSVENGIAISADQPQSVRRAPTRPDAVPVAIDVPAFVGDQGVGARAVGVGGEAIGVPAVEEGVEHDQDGVVLREVGVLLHLLGDDRLGIAVTRPYRDIERRGSERDRELGGLARRLSLARLALHEPSAAIGAGPCRVAQIAVDVDRLRQRASAVATAAPGRICAAA